MQPEDFSPYLHGLFQVNLPEGGEPVPVELRSCRLHPERTEPWLRARPFTLVFHGPAARALYPKVYHVVWPNGSRTEKMHVQIVVGSSPHGAVYEVIFN